ncbi:MAG TPA: cobyrinate a,c-diamide synthase [Alphaproteobacteria bacterium]
MADGPRGLIIAAPATAQGKTTLMLGLLAALTARGLQVGALKIGPDFIDPGFHRAAGAAASFNLDHWAMRPATRASLVAAAAAATADADLVLGEGMMGLFDGAPGGGGSTADIAAETGWPAILAIDAARQAQSIAALAQGFARFRLDVRVAGVVLTKVGGPAHRALLVDALAAAKLRVFGLVGYDPGLALPERHLGLVQAREHKLDPLAARAAAAVASGVDLDALLAAAAPARVGATHASIATVPPPGRRIAIADDAAFAFTYAHICAGWRAAGAEILRFSPLADEAPPADCDAVFLPGGYPELHAGRLAANRKFRDGMFAAAVRGAAIYGECGGYMALGEELVDAKGIKHAMLGLLPVTTSFAKPALHIGYRRLELAAKTPLGPAGARFRGHEFHFSNVVTEADTDRLFAVADADGSALGPAGLRRGNVFGSYLHLIDAA